jgi:hypothetical protein
MHPKIRFNFGIFGTFNRCRQSIGPAKKKKLPMYTLLVLGKFPIQHSHDKSTIIAGASGVNEVRIFAGQSKHSFAVKIFDLKQGCYSVDASKKDKNICFSTAKQGFFVCNYGKV